MTIFPTRILLATDGSAGSVRAARSAMETARAFYAELHVAHVVPVAGPHHHFGDAEGPGTYEENVQWARELLGEQVRRIEESGGRVAKTHLRTGEPDAELVSLGEEIGADLIVVGSRGLSPLRHPLGSVSDSIAAHAKCSVLIVRGE